MGEMNQCAWGLCWKIILQWSKWATEVPSYNTDEYQPSMCSMSTWIILQSYDWVDYVKCPIYYISCNTPVMFRICSPCSVIFTLITKRSVVSRNTKSIAHYCKFIIKPYKSNQHLLCVLGAPLILYIRLHLLHVSTLHRPFFFIIAATRC
jgi:hypothetical protein